MNTITWASNRLTICCILFTVSETPVYILLPRNGDKRLKGMCLLLNDVLNFNIILALSSINIDYIDFIFWVEIREDLDRTCFNVSSLVSKLANNKIKCITKWHLSMFLYPNSSFQSWFSGAKNQGRLLKMWVKCLIFSSYRCLHKQSVYFDTSFLNINMHLYVLL